MPEQLKKEAGVSQPAGSEGPKKSAPKKSLFRGKGGTKKKNRGERQKSCFHFCQTADIEKPDEKSGGDRPAGNRQKDHPQDRGRQPRRPFQDQAAGHPPGRLGRDWQELDRI